MKAFLVDNSVLQAKSPGLGYRFSKKPEDKDKKANAPWGSTVTGIDEGDGWLKLILPQGERYLPFVANGKSVLTQQESSSASLVSSSQVVIREGSLQVQAAATAQGVAPPLSTHKLQQPSDLGGGLPGYVFICSNETEQECAALQLFGSAQWELNKMKRFIRPETELFLFNFESLTLRGAFTPVGLPEQDLAMDAFGRKYRAQLRVAFNDAPLREVHLDRKLAAGPKSASEVEVLHSQLRKGQLTQASMWTRQSDQSEPSAKRNKAGGVPAKEMLAKESAAEVQHVVSDEEEHVDMADEGNCDVADGLDCDEEVVEAEIEGDADTTEVRPSSRSTAAPAPPIQSQNCKPSSVVLSAKPGSILAQKPKPAPAKQPQQPQHPLAVKPPAIVKAKASASWPTRTVTDNKGNANAASGYVFVCGKATEQECQTLCLFGLPPRELMKMESCIKPTTELFLFNFDTTNLMGPFLPAGVPAKDIAPTAFGGRFSSQVRVKRSEVLREVKVGSRLVSGPKSESEVEELRARLERGNAVTASGQAVWGGTPAKSPNLPAVRAASTSLEEPLAKRPRQGDLAGDSQCKTALVGATAIGTTPAAKVADTTDAKPAGYVFMCAASTLKEVQQRQLFGSPQRELAQMKKTITPDTKLFLFNIQSSIIQGPFLATSEVQQDLVRNAFGNRFSAHVRVRPAQAPLMEVKLATRIAAGPKSTAEVSAVLHMLHGGKPAEPNVQADWGTSTEQAEASESNLKEHTKEFWFQKDSRPAPANLPVDGQAFRALNAEARKDFVGDLEILGESFGLKAQLVLSPGQEGVDLNGDPDAIVRAKGDLLGMFEFYGVAPSQS